MSVIRIAAILLLVLLVLADLSAQALRFAVSEVYVSEKADHATLVVRRSWESAGLLTAEFHTVNGTAAAGQDFQATSGVLSFATNGAETTILIPLKDDCIREGEEFFRVVLTNLMFDGLPFGESASATVYLGDDETPGTIEQRLGVEADLLGDLIVPLKDGRYLVNGGYGTNAGIIRLNADFSIDPTFQLELPADYIHERSRITYFIVSPTGLIAATAISIDTEGFFFHFLGTFDPTGSLLSWQRVSYFNVFVGPLVWESDDSLLLGLSPGGVIHRFSKLGTPDPDFQSPTNLYASRVTALALQPDGKILAVAGTNLVRLHQNGALDSSFVAPGTYGSFQRHLGIFSALPEPILVQDEGTVWVPRLRPHVDENGYLVCEIVRLGANGALHSIIPVSTNYQSYISQLALQADGKLLVAGSFDSFNGHSYSNLVRLHRDGTFDQTFGLGFSFPRADWVSLDGRGRPFVAAGGQLWWGRTASQIFQLFTDPVPRWRAPVRHGSDFVWQADAVLGDRYVLQSSTNLSLWLDRSTNLATHCTISFTNKAPRRHEFFRLKRAE